jgi:hypothetical protein
MVTAEETGGRPARARRLVLGGTSTRIARGSGAEVTLRRDMGRSAPRIERSLAQSFSAEEGYGRVLALRGRGGVERPDAWRSDVKNGTGVVSREGGMTGA